MAQTWGNLGLLHLKRVNPDAARPLLARAYLVFDNPGSHGAQTVARGLVRACGKAANTGGRITVFIELSLPSPAFFLWLLLGMLAERASSMPDLTKHVFETVNWARARTSASQQPRTSDLSCAG